MTRAETPDGQEGTSLMLLLVVPDDDLYSVLAHEAGAEFAGEGAVRVQLDLRGAPGTSGT